MSNQSVQTVGTSNDKFKVALAVVATIAGVVGFFILKGQNKPALMCAGALVAGLAIAVLLLWTSATGRDFLAFALRSQREAGQYPAAVDDHRTSSALSVVASFLWAGES